jgi:hypothetical protein
VTKQGMPRGLGHDLYLDRWSQGDQDTDFRRRGPVNDQVIVGDIPQEPPGFQPRARLLAELNRAEGSVSVVHGAKGMRGVGKTQLAAAYARDRRAEGWRLVAWVTAENPWSLTSGLVAVAEAMGVGDRHTVRDAAEAGLAVRQHLESDGSRCLVVFDGAEDPEFLRPFIPVTGEARVLITSARPSLADLGVNVGVDIFSPEEALSLLTSRTGLTDASGAAAVAAELGYLPLALTQAVTAIDLKHLNYGRYLRRLRAMPADYLGLGGGHLYPQRAAQAISLSLDAVRATDGGELCAALMEILAVLSAAGVRRELLHAAGQAGSLVRSRRRSSAAADVVDRAVDQLAGQSLITLSLNGQNVVAHQLVTRVIREVMAQRGRLAAVCRAAASVLDARAEALAASPDRQGIRDIPQQIMALQENTAVSADADDELARSLLGLRLWALYHLNELGDSAPQAVAVGEPLMEDLERVLGPDHPDTLSARNSLAVAYRAAGRAADAIRLHEKTLAARERVRGPDHPSTLSSRNNLAVAYRAAGRAADAAALHQQVLAVRERVLGPDHPDTRASRNKLAAAYRAAGQAADAIPLYEQVLATLERLRGPDHLSTLGPRSDLANAYRTAGRAADAVALHEQVLAARERLLGPDHLDTLSSLNNLAVAYRAAGRAADAVALHEQVLAARERLLGPDHPDTLSSRNNLAASYHAAGQDNR